jgi:TPR repeat protein
LFDLASDYEYDARDYNNARKYYEEAINKYNHPLAAFNYGIWFLEGRYGTPKNDKPNTGCIAATIQHK